jgi:5'-nucleotidase
MDGVLADFEARFLELWREQYPDEVYYPLDQRTSFYIHEQYGKELSEKVRSITRAPGFFRSLPPVADGLMVLNKLVSHGHTVLICTSPLTSTPTCHQEKYDWVLNHLGPEFARTMLIVKDKTMVRGDVLIDDRPEFKGIFEPTWRHILFHQPYNTTVENVDRVMNWLDVLEYFQPRQ